VWNEGINIWRKKLGEEGERKIKGGNFTLVCE